MDLETRILTEELSRDILLQLKENIDSYPNIIHNESIEQKLKEGLSHSDPKIRKNCALLLGRFSGVGQFLLDAYFKEETDFVKEAYLKAYVPHLSKEDATLIKDIYENLSLNKDVNQKHIQAQLRVLSPLVAKVTPQKRKVVKLVHEPIDVVLTTLPYYQFLLIEHLQSFLHKPVTQGVLVRTTSIYDILNLRVYKDLLIPVPKAMNLNMDVQSITKGLEQSGLQSLLTKLYGENLRFSFRLVDVLRRKDPQLIRKVSDQLLVSFPTMLLQTTKREDIEIILKEVNPGKVNVYIKPLDLVSHRFDYRKEVISTSLQPYVAASLVQLAKPYLTEDASVLDPFCGSGTLLIEKNIQCPSHFCMGVDVYQDGINIAKRNTKLAKQHIHYVHKDALRFVHNEMFDEIITDMPTLAQVTDEDHLAEIYNRFFMRLPRLVKPEGYVFIYTSEISLIRKNLRLHSGYITLEEHYDIPRGKNMFYFFIMKMK